MSMKRQQLVMIEWFDSAMHGTEQMSREEASELGVIWGVSAGMLVHESKEQIVIALDWFYEEDQFRQVASYPKACIKKITRRYLDSKKTICEP